MILKPIQLYIRAPPLKQFLPFVQKMFISELHCAFSVLFASKSIGEKAAAAAAQTKRAFWNGDGGWIRRNDDETRKQNHVVFIDYIVDIL